MRGFDARQISRRYCDRHTSAFVAFGQRGSDGAMHRAVWGPGTATHQHAFRYVEDQIAMLLQDLPPSFGTSNVVDLGCGVGASLCYLAARLPVRGTGITLSPVQARFAEERIRKSGFADRIRCIEGDYCDPSPGTGPADLAYAIESFVHVVDPARFFAQCHNLLRPGGLLVICDDFLRSTREPGAAHSIERFRRGWHVNTLIEAEELHSLARAAGFEHEATTDSVASSRASARAGPDDQRTARVVWMAPAGGDSIGLPGRWQRPSDVHRARMDRLRCGAVSAPRLMPFSTTMAPRPCGSVRLQADRERSG